MAERVGLYPGTFDPVTNGHLDLIARGQAVSRHIALAYPEVLGALNYAAITQVFYHPMVAFESH